MSPKPVVIEEAEDAKESCEMELRRSQLTEACLSSRSSSDDDDGSVVDDSSALRASNFFLSKRELTLKKKRRRRVLSVVGVVTLIGAGSGMAVLFREDLLRTANLVGDLPKVQGGAAYTGTVALWLLLLLPTSLLEVLGGSIFGLWMGALCAAVGKLIGSFVSFGLGRSYKEKVQRHFLDDVTTPQVDDDDERPRQKKMSYVGGVKLAMKAKPFSTCLALRLAYVPEAVQNFTPAVLDAPFPPFALATALGSSAYALLWANLGASLTNVDDVLEDGLSPEKIAFTAIGILSLIVVLALVHWNTKRMIRNFVALQQQHDDQENQENQVVPTRDDDDERHHHHHQSGGESRMAHYAFDDHDDDDDTPLQEQRREGYQGITPSASPSAAIV